MAKNLQRLCLDCLLENVFRASSSTTSPPTDSIFNQLPLPPALLNKLKFRFRAKIEWITKHDHIFKGQAVKFVEDFIWLNDFTIDHVETKSILLSKSIESHLKFELASVYCNIDDARSVWNSLSQDEKSNYLNERSFRYDPIVCFWTGICASQPWLADSYLGTV